MDGTIPLGMISNIGRGQLCDGGSGLIDSVV